MASSGVSRMQLKNFISCSTPNGPPSWLAPLSDSSTMMRVVELAELARAPSTQPADLGVGVVEEGGEGLLEAGGEAAVVLRQLVPRLDAGVARRQLGAGGEQAQLLLAGEPLVAGDVPALVEAAAVLLEVLVRAPGAGAWVAPKAR